VTLEQFQDAVAKGLGRAYLHVHDFEPAALLPVLEQACCSYQGFGRQFEERDGEWVWGLVEAAGHAEHCRTVVLQEVFRSENSWDVRHMVDILAVLAARGDQEAMEALRRKANDPDSYAGFALIRIAGPGALTWLIDNVLATFSSEDEWQLSSWIDTVKEEHGEEAVAAALEAADPGNVDIANRIPDEYRRIPAPETDVSIGDFQSFLQELGPTPNKHHAHKTSYAFRAGGSEAEFRLAAQAMLEEHDPIRLRAFHNLFRGRDFPLDADALIARAAEPIERARPFLELLTHIKDERVRSAALMLLQREELHFLYLMLLVENYVEGDDQVIASALDRWPNDPWLLHQVCPVVKDIYRANPDPKLGPLLYWAYEKTPCSYCRTFLAETLLYGGLATEALLEELPFDAEPDTRKHLAEYLAEEEEGA